MLHPEVQTLLTKLKKAKGHESTEVTIDWSDISRDQLIVLARARIFYRLQWEFQQAKQVPREIEVRAIDYVQPDKLHEDSEPLPKKLDKELQKLLSQLTPEERRVLLGNLE